MYTTSYSKITLLLEATEFRENAKEWIVEPGFKFKSSETMSHDTITFWAQFGLKNNHFLKFL